MESIHAGARRRSRRCAMSGNPISSYLDELERELRLRRAPRRRLLAETADHLRSCADDIAAEEQIGVGEAERKALARFGTAAVVAGRFAHAAAPRRRAAPGLVVTAFAAYWSPRSPSWLLRRHGCSTSRRELRACSRCRCPSSRSH